MHRNDESGNVSGRFTTGNPATGTPATVVGMAWLNAVQEEAAAFVESVGGSLEKDNWAQTQAAQAVLAGAWDLWNADDTDTGAESVVVGGAKCVQFSAASDGKVWLADWLRAGPAENPGSSVGYDLVPMMQAWPDAAGGGDVKLDVDWYITAPGAAFSLAAPAHSANVTISLPAAQDQVFAPDLSALALPATVRTVDHSWIKVALKRDITVAGNSAANLVWRYFFVLPQIAE